MDDNKWREEFKSYRGRIRDDDPRILELYEWSLQFRSPGESGGECLKDYGEPWSSCDVGGAPRSDGASLSQDLRHEGVKSITKDGLKRLKICKRYLEDRYSFISLINQASNETYNPLKIARFRERQKKEPRQDLAGRSAAYRAAVYDRWAVSNDDICEYCMFIFDRENARLSLRREPEHPSSRNKDPDYAASANMRARGLKLAADRMVKRINLVKSALRGRAYCYQFNDGVHRGIKGSFMKPLSRESKKRPTSLVGGLANTLTSSSVISDSRKSCGNMNHSIAKSNVTATPPARISNSTCNLREGRPHTVLHLPDMELHAYPGSPSMQEGYDVQPHLESSPESYKSVKYAHSDTNPTDEGSVNKGAIGSSHYSFIDSEILSEKHLSHPESAPLDIVPSRDQSNPVHVIDGSKRSCDRLFSAQKDTKNAQGIDAHGPHKSKFPLQGNVDGVGSTAGTSLLIPDDSQAEEISVAKVNTKESNLDAPDSQNGDPHTKSFDAPRAFKGPHFVNCKMKLPLLNEIIDTSDQKLGASKYTTLPRPVSIRSNKAKLRRMRLIVKLTERIKRLKKGKDLIFEAPHKSDKSHNSLNGLFRSQNRHPKVLFLYANRDKLCKFEMELRYHTGPSLLRGCQSLDIPVSCEQHGNMTAEHAQYEDEQYIINTSKYADASKLLPDSNLHRWSDYDLEDIRRSISEISHEVHRAQFEAAGLLLHVLEVKNDMERVANLSERDNRSDSEEADLLSKSRNSFFSMETLIKAIDISNSNNMLLDEAETLFVEVSNMYEGAVRENQSLQAIMDPLFRRTTSVAKRVNVEISLASSTISEYIEKYDETLIFRERFLAQCYYGFIEYALNVVGFTIWLLFKIKVLLFEIASFLRFPLNSQKLTTDASPCVEIQDNK